LQDKAADAGGLPPVKNGSADVILRPTMAQRCIIALLFFKLFDCKLYIFDIIILFVLTVKSKMY